MLTINTDGYSPKTGQPVFQDKVAFKEGTKEFIFDIIIYWQPESFLLEGKLLAGTELECSRCLKAIKGKKDFSFKDLYLRNPDHINEYEEEFSGNIFLAEDGTINLADSLIAALAEYKAEKVLCSEDCKGLCHICGANLNETDCKCNNEDLDPRLEILKNFKF